MVQRHGTCSTLAVICLLVNPNSKGRESSSQACLGSDEAFSRRRVSSIFWKQIALLFGIFFVATDHVCAEIVVETLRNKATYVDRVGFRVQLEPGYQYEARLDNRLVAPQFWQFAGPGYHTFSVSRISELSGQKEERSYRFVVQDAIRGGSEWGLAPWTPRPNIPSAPEAFKGASIELVYPRRIPAGMKAPIIAWIRDDDGQNLRANGSLSLGLADSSINIRRGVGFNTQVLPRNQTSLSSTAHIAEAATPWQIEIEKEPIWDTVSGTLAADTVWEQQARVFVADDLIVPVNVTLTIHQGTIVTLAEGVDVIVNGSLVVQGKDDNPVLFAPRNQGQLWGGFFFPSAPATAAVQHSIVTGTGAHKTWFFANRGGRSHRPEQAAFNFWTGTVGHLDSVQIVENAGQALHGENAEISLSNSLVQECQTVGQFNEGAVTIDSSALVGFPNDSPRFVDGDNDALYFTFGTHTITNTLIGWTKDDGIDAGGNDPGTVTVENCWFEACFHEGMALSGSNKQVTVSNSVFLNNGQGVEVGYLSPHVTVTTSLLSGNGVGLRFGDNYFREHAGSLSVNDSLSIFNERDIWGLTANLWAEDLSRITAVNNRLVTGLDLHPNNSLWLSDEAHPQQLARFSELANGIANIGFTTTAHTASSSPTTLSLDIALSDFSSQAITANIELQSDSENTASLIQLDDTSVHFAPGQMVTSIPIHLIKTGFPEVSTQITLRLNSATNALIDPKRSKFEISFEGLRTESEIISSESAWHFQIGTGEASTPTTAWRFPSFDDLIWPLGPGPIGYGSFPLGTSVLSMKDQASSLFLRQSFHINELASIDTVLINTRFDDGFVAWINGREIMRIGVAGSVTDPLPFDTLATETLAEPETLTREFTKDELPSLFAGKNHLAVQVFNDTIDSPDLWFDLSLRTRSALDLDQDSLPDSWETHWVNKALDDEWTSILSILPDADLDGDGQTNRAEYLAGTDPLDQTMRLGLQFKLKRPEGHLELSFTQQASRHYSIQQANTIGSEWSTIETISPRTSETHITVLIPADEAVGLFRVIARY